MKPVPPQGCSSPRAVPVLAPTCRGGRRCRCRCCGAGSFPGSREATAAANLPVALENSRKKSSSLRSPGLRCQRCVDASQAEQPQVSPYHQVPPGAVPEGWGTNSSATSLTLRMRMGKLRHGARKGRAVGTHQGNASPPPLHPKNRPVAASSTATWLPSQPPPHPPPGAETKGNVLWNWKNKKKKKRDCQRACQLLHPALRQLGQCSTPPDPPGCDTGGWWLRAARPALLPAHRETEAGGTEGRHWERWQQCPPSIPCAPPGQRGALSSALAPDAGGFISLPLYF